MAMIHQCRQWLATITTRLTGRGASSSGAACKSAREDEQACEAGGTPKRRIEQSAPDDFQRTFGGDEKRVKSCDDGGASGGIVVSCGGQLRCSDEETQSLLFSCKPRAAASGNVLDPSGSGVNVQQLRSFEIDRAKHKIFLSHSGEVKPFVEQLCVDLEARGYLFPFFDQRHNSLPKGKDFAPLIKQAARQCNVAVIVLSEKFLCSKWPMIELAEFHAAKQKENRGMSMLPLFYKLTVGDLGDESIEGRWMPVWNELASRDERIDMSEWAAAVRALRGVNGLPFGKHSNSEVGYRKEIVGSIWKISPPDLLHDSAREMVGYDRICESVSEEFVYSHKVEASVLGLYGSSGLGKTTVAKALCDYFAGEYGGRVCYVDMGTMTRMKRQKRILKSLCGVEDKVLRWLSDDSKGLKLIRDCMNREPVLLVIDNLSNNESSRGEAHAYLTLGFHPSSKVMITARSKEVLQDLLPGLEFCVSIPKLNEVEAGMIFLRSAIPMKCFSSVTEEEERVLRLCVHKCLLESNYHPLALSALGDYFYRLIGNTEMLEWKDCLERDHELMTVVLQSPSITSIVHLQFNTFNRSERLLFLDIACYLRPFRSYGEQLYEDQLERLGMLYEEAESVIDRRVQNLKRSGMIDWDYDGNGGRFFNVHSLYREFAEWYITEHEVTGLKNAWGVFHPCDTSLKSDHSRSKCISNLVRLRVFDNPRARIWILTSKKLQEMHNLVLLQLYDCTNLKDLNLSGLDSLRNLELWGLPQLVTLRFTESPGIPEDGGIFDSLVNVRLDSLDSLSEMSDLRSCTSLRFVEFSWCPKVSSLEVLGCSLVRNIKLLCLELHQLEGLPNFRSLHYLTRLELSLDFGVGCWAELMDIVGPSAWMRRSDGRSATDSDSSVDSDELSADLDKSSDDSDAHYFVRHPDAFCHVDWVAYMPREKQFLKEGLSIIHNILSYMYEQSRCLPENFSGQEDYWIKWSFCDGDKEDLSLLGCTDGNLSLAWRFGNAKDYVD